MEDIDSYLRLCMRQYAVQQDLDEYGRDRLLKAANMRPGGSRLLAPFHRLGHLLTQAHARLERWLAWSPTHFSN